MVAVNDLGSYDDAVALRAMLVRGLWYRDRLNPAYVLTDSQNAVLDEWALEVGVHGDEDQIYGQTTPATATGPPEDDVSRGQRMPPRRR